MSNNAPTFYLKYNVDIGDFFIDTEYKSNGFYFSIKKVKITEDQANEFIERIFERYDQRGKFFNIVYAEYEFDVYFYVCEDCGYATSKPDYKKRYGQWCYSCYCNHKHDIYSAARAKAAKQKRILRLREYCKSDQGKADVCGIKNLKANIDVQLMRHNKTRQELSEILNLNVTRMFKENKSIKIEYLYSIAEWLFIPIDLLVKIPKGNSGVAKKINGIPVSIYKRPMRKL